MKHFREISIDLIRRPWMPVMVLSMAFATLAGCGSSKNSPTSPSYSVSATTTAALVRAEGSNQSFAFQADNIGSISMTGGGVFDLQANFVRGGGDFRTSQDITGGPLAGLKAGEGVRWSAEQVLPSSGFKCSASDPAKTAVTDDNTVVLQVNFYRQGDGNTTPFTAKVFVSNEDENPDDVGIQNVWIQGVGCDDAQVNLR